MLANLVGPVCVRKNLNVPLEKYIRIEVSIEHNYTIRIIQENINRSIIYVETRVKNTSSK